MTGATVGASFIAGRVISRSSTASDLSEDVSHGTPCHQQHLDSGRFQVRPEETRGPLLWQATAAAYGLRRETP